MKPSLLHRESHEHCGLSDKIPRILWVAPMIYQLTAKLINKILQFKAEDWFGQLRTINLHALFYLDDNLCVTMNQITNYVALKI